MKLLEQAARIAGRVDQAVKRRLHMDRLPGRIATKIPGLRRAGAGPLAVASVLLVVVLIGAGLWRLDKGPGLQGSTRSDAGTLSPGAQSGEGPTSLDTATDQFGASAGSSAGNSQRRGSAVAGTVAGLTATGRGVTDSTITIGVVILQGLAEIRQAFTGQECGRDCGDNRLQAQAVIDYVNSQGGVAKRKIVPVYHDVEASERYDIAAQEACADFTEDHQVFAVVDLDGSGPREEQLVACLADRNTPRIGYTETDQKFADDHAPYFYAPSFMNLTRAGPIHVNGLLKQGFFEAGAKIGLLRYDRPSDQRAAEQGIKRTLTANNLKLTDEVGISYLSRVSDLSVVAAQTSNAALRFRTNEISHLLIQDRRALGFIFMNSAESQNFRPRYGLTSFSQPRELPGLVPAEQLKRALGVGWLPVTDVQPQRIPPPNASRRLCIEILKKAGVSSPELNQAAMSYCDDFFFLKLVGDSAKTLSTAGFQTAAEELGTRFEPLLTHSAQFGPRRHDGASGWRPLAFDDACKCFDYVGGLEPAG